MHSPTSSSILRHVLRKCPWFSRNTQLPCNTRPMLCHCCRFAQQASMHKLYMSLLQVLSKQCTTWTTVRQTCTLPPQKRTQRIGTITATQHTQRSLTHKTAHSVLLLHFAVKCTLHSTLHASEEDSKEYAQLHRRTKAADEQFARTASGAAPLTKPDQHCNASSAHASMQRITLSASKSHTVRPLLAFSPLRWTTLGPLQTKNTNCNSWQQYGSNRGLKLVYVWLMCSAFSCLCGIHHTGHIDDLTLQTKTTSAVAASATPAAPPATAAAEPTPSVIQCTQ